MANVRLFNKLQNKIESKPKFAKVWHFVMNKYFITFLAFVLLVFFFDKNNIIGWVKEYTVLYNQEKVIEKYHKDLEYLDARIQELSSNRDSLEKFAREQYYFHEKDEDIFIVQPKR